jgi:hypothetical protein
LQRPNRGGRYQHGDRERRGPRPPYRRTQHPAQRQLRPMPIGDKCNPLCPFFVCTKHALVIVNEFYRGRSVKVAYCRLFGGKCIGPACKYASCKLNAMLPDGRCAKAIKFKKPKYTDEDLIKEAEELDDYDAEEFK